RSPCSFIMDSATSCSARILLPSASEESRTSVSLSGQLLRILISSRTVMVGKSMVTERIWQDQINHHVGTLVTVEFTLPLVGPPYSSLVPIPARISQSLLTEA